VPNEIDNVAGEFAILPTGGDLTIQNASGGKVAVDGSGLSRVFDINPSFDPNNPSPKFTVTLQGFTIQGGRAFDATGANVDGPAASGGGIRDIGNASLTLTNVVVTNNSATADGGGVAMENTVSVPWTLTVNNSTITDNHAGDAGGGLETDGSGKFFVTDSTITSNTSVNQGAGIWLDAIQVGTVFQSANLTVTGTFISNNTAVAANNAGGGIGNAGNGTVTLNSSTLSSNYSGGVGGGFGDQNAQGTLIVLNSTLVHNVAIGNGGGIAAAGPSTTLNDTTITANASQAQGGGLNVASAAFTLNNTIVAGNFVNNNGGMNFQGTAPDVFAAVTLGSGNFIGSGDANLTGITNGTNGNQIGTTTAPLNPLLGPLQNNGGATPTEVPLAGSPVIDTGINGVLPAGSLSDQRGFLRVVNTTVDIGAAEFQPPATTTLLTLPANPVLPGQAVVFTATVTAQTPGSNTPQGTVTFRIDGMAQAPMSLVNGVATLTVTTLLPGAHSITATYNGDVNFNTSASTPQTLTIGLATPTVTLVVTPLATGRGQPITLTVTVAGLTGAPAPTGQVNFLDDGMAIGTGQLSGGTVALTLSSLHAGANHLSAVYAGDTNYQTVTSGATTMRIGTTNEQYVDALYLALLHRHADFPGAQGFVDQLNAGVSGHQVVLEIEGSTEYRTNLVNQFYQDILGRQADPSGLNTFVGMLASGSTDEQVKAMIFGSAEFFQKSGGTNAGFLAALYKNGEALGRYIDQGGLATWSAALTTGGLSRSQVAAAILNSLEYEQSLIGLDYQQYLGRGADPGSIGFRNGLASGKLRNEDVIASLLDSTEFHNALLS
jgi:hypothetical protein